jgi:uncharacterized RDD family membrane protein YckC
VDTAPIPALRVVQFTIDLALVALLCLVPLAVVLLLPRNPDGTIGSLLVSIPVVLLALVACAVLSWSYLAWWPAVHAGQTPAMRLLHLAVVSADGRPATTLQHGLRWVMLLVDGMAFGAVGLGAMLLTPRQQRVGDVLADTVVVRRPGARRPR